METFVLSEYVDGDVAGVEILVVTDDLDTPEFVVKANARRDPLDKPDTDLALLLAYARAYEKIGKKLLKRAEGRVRHNDYVREQKALHKEESRNRSLTDIAYTKITRPITEQSRIPTGGYRSANYGRMYGRAY